MEMLVVLALTALICGFAVIVSMDTYRGSNFRAERNMLVALLERARAQSIANYCGGTCTANDGAKHGVAINPADHPGKYVLFQTQSTYSGRTANDKTVDSIFDKNPTITLGGLTEVVFAQLSGQTTTVGGLELVLSDSAGHISTTTIGTEGQISWTN
jgi:Tfp pilus assembly protein FimT